MSTQPQQHSDTEQSTNNLDRRAFMRRSAAGTLGAVGTIAAANHADRLPVDRALAIDDAVVGPDGWEWRETTGVQGFEYMAGAVSDLLFGSDQPHSGYTGADALITNVEENILTNASADERVMTSIQNHINGSENVALAKGKSALLTEMNDGAERSDARDAMMDTVDEYYTTIQTNIVQHWNAQINQFNHMLTQAEEHEDTSPSAIIYDNNHSGARDVFTYHDDFSLELLDGSEHDYAAMGVVTGENSSSVGYSNWAVTIDFRSKYDADDFKSDIGFSSSDNWYEANSTRVTEVSSSYLQPGPFSQSWSDVLDARDNVVSALSGFAEDVYNQYEPGDIPTEDLVDPITAFTELAQDYDGQQGQMAYASMLGIPTTADASVWIQVLEDSLEDYFDADDFENADEFDDLDEEQLDELIDSIPYDAIEADIYTQHTPEDNDGNEVGFEVGKHYTPADWDVPLYIGYTVIYEDGDGEIQEESDFVQLENEFVIFAAEDQDGNDIDSFENRSTTAQTADIDELEAELEALREEQLRLQREAQDEGAGLAGIPGLESIAGFLGIGLGSTVVVIGAAALAYVSLMNPVSR